MSVRVIVVGAGAFGGWTALWCRRRGAQVTLIDAWEPGHARASSGGITRLLRCGYGPAEEFTALAAKAAQWWRRESEWLGDVFRRSGVLWLFQTRADGYAQATREALRRHEVPHQVLAPAELQRRWPLFRSEDLESALFEPEAGFLFASRACARVAAQLEREGGRLASAFVPGLPAAAAGSRLHRLPTSGGEQAADSFVFACGPWLAKLFPEVMAGRLRVTRQEVCQWAIPGHAREQWRPERLPCWIRYAAELSYGVPAHDGCSVKTGVHRPGPEFDPDRSERTLSLDGIAAARAALAQSLHGIDATAGPIGGEVCQYELAPLERPFCLRHPAWENVWLLGGGSGHGFKLGPEIGRRAAAQVLEGGHV